MTRIYQLITILILSTLSIVVLLSFASCSDAKQAQKGYDKFIKHGGKIEYKKDTVIVTDTIKGIDGKDSIVYRDMQYVCPELQLPKTRWQTRIEYRYKKSKDKLIYRTLYRTKKVYIKQQNKQDSKAFKWYHYILLVVAFILGAYLRGIIASLFYVIKK
jgi:hypothetical protein